MSTVDDKKEVGPYWYGGWSDCETCGPTLEEGGFYQEDNDKFWGFVTEGCYGGSNVSSTSWPEIEAWLQGYAHIPSFSDFATEVKQYYDRRVNKEEKNGSKEQHSTG